MHALRLPGHFRSGLLAWFWAALAAALFCLAVPEAEAVPSFAVQTGQPCQTCHVGGFGPQLTAFGRAFKMQGYTLGSDGVTTPISVMAVASYVRTQEDQPDLPAAGFHANGAITLDQASIFVAGRVNAHLGGFVQTTYDGVDKAWAWDNLDLRAIGRAQIKGADVLYGASLNNSPTVSDPWNTLAAWGYPYTDSALAPSPAAEPLLSGALAQDSLGLTAYAWINSTVFVEAGAYGSPGANSLARLGADPFDPGDIDGLAPYGRVALQRGVGGGSLELGAFGLRADIHPGRVASAGSDRYTDLGLDASFLKTLGHGGTLTLNGRYTHEQETLDATCALAAMSAGCAKGRLNDLRADASYYRPDGMLGFTIGAFDTFGPANPVLYADDRTLKPDSSGLMFQVDHTPFGHGGSPLGPRFNVRVGLQYTLYDRFDGARKNYDGLGRNASDNNTARVFAWFAY
ncbi:hypothetical protein [Phenylobacterium sp.]|uniref:hypothetical protein n=1 Tax=Phenylobacterium sp. TaxID=1871053 RepID=UPI0035B46AF6